MAHIELQNACLTFRMRRHRRLSLKAFLLGGMYRQSVNPISEVRALQDVSLDISAGERLGIIGHNGSGKSTLLRVLAGVYPLTSGQRTVEGRISSLFDVALGGLPDASGWSSIVFRGYLQGENPKSIRAKMQEIAEFSELGKFLDMPVRHYSAGMAVRLAFSIATAIEPEILLVDEVMSAGDMAFQAKARRRMTDVIAKAKVMVMVSHDLSSIASICQRVVWLEEGRVRQVGPADEVVAAYQEHMLRRSQSQAQAPVQAAIAA